MGVKEGSSISPRVLNYYNYITIRPEEVFLDENVAFIILWTLGFRSDTDTGYYDVKSWLQEFITEMESDVDDIKQGHLKSSNLPEISRNGLMGEAFSLKI